jgi:peptidoglycan hydrolase CwlO-like protein
MKYKKIAKIACCFGLIACIIASDSTISFATRTVSEIEAEQAALQDEIDAIDSDIYAVVSQIAEIQAQIDDTEAEIAETEEALQSAQAARDEQYEAMKLRIKYMYETPDPSVFEMLMESGSISQFLNRLDYANSVHEYDDEKLNQFIATIAEIEELADALDIQKKELESAKSELAAQETELEAVADAKRGEMDDLDAE